jgi:hypothetical protein
MAKEQPKNYSDLWMGISFIIAFAWWLSILWRFNTSPTLKHGRDTILYHDTAYVIQFKIDTAIYIDPNPDNEQPERP